MRSIFHWLRLLLLVLLGFAWTTTASFGATVAYDAGNAELLVAKTTGTVCDSVRTTGTGQSSAQD